MIYNNNEGVIHIDDSNSDAVNVVCRVSQGYVLGTSSSYCIWEELVKLSTGFSVYKLYLNVTTTNYMVFGNIKRITVTDIVALVFRALHDLAPAYVSTLITPYEPRRALRSTSSALLCVPRHNLERYGRRSFCAEPVLLNSLPEDMRLADSLNSFKSHLKTHYFKLAYNL